MSDISLQEDEALPTEPEGEVEEDIDIDNLSSILMGLVKKVEDEDEDAHDAVFNDAIKGEFYWSNRQYVFDETLSEGKYGPSADDESTLYTANEYRPNGESIIAAMAVQPPQVNFYPDDAENADDIAAANARQRIAALIQKHNNAISLVTRILFILYNQAFVAVYNYSKESAKYGTYEKEEEEPTTEEVTKNVCPSCGADSPESLLPPITCEQCQTEYLVPERVTESQIVTKLVRNKYPKVRECLHAFGPQHVKIAPYAQTQEDTPYLILKFEQHPSRAKFQFSEFAQVLDRKGKVTHHSEEERSLRAKIYRGDYDHLDTWTLVWLRPWMYNDLPEGKEKAYLQKNFETGVKVTYVNDILVDIAEEDLDDHWTLNDNPLSTYIAGEPIGKAGLPLQDATNLLLNLSLDTVTHGVPQTFASPDILDFAKYSESSIEPGKVYPTKTLPQGRSLQDFILTTRTSTLSQEVQGVRDALKQSSQLATGAFPSIYGGNIQGSRTASEYAQSRNQALQRLSITWSMLKALWAKVMNKSTNSFVKEMLERQYDEKQVQKNGNTYINIWIKQSELTGRVGEVEPEIDEQLPTSWAQQRDVLMRLIEMNSPMLNDVISMPENAVIVKGALGFAEFNLPGYNDSLKQLTEIQQMLNMPEGAETASVQVDPDIDNHEVEAAACRDFLTGETGIALKVTNPNAYERIKQHYLMHKNFMMQAMQQAQPVVNNSEQSGVSQ